MLTIPHLIRKLHVNYFETSRKPPTADDQSQESGTFRLTPSRRHSDGQSIEYHWNRARIAAGSSCSRGPPLLEPTIGYHRYCDCNVDVDAEPLHVLDCVASLHKYNRRRHDAVVRALTRLVTYITQCLGSQQLQVEVPPVETSGFLDTGDSTGSRVKADIVVHHGNTRYVLDITICEPARLTD